MPTLSEPDPPPPPPPPPAVPTTRPPFSFLRPRPSPSILLTSGSTTQPGRRVGVVWCAYTSAAARTPLPCPSCPALSYPFPSSLPSALAHQLTRSFPSITISVSVVYVHMYVCMCVVPARSFVQQHEHASSRGRAMIGRHVFFVCLSRRSGSAQRAAAAAAATAAAKGWHGTGGRLGIRFVSITRASPGERRGAREDDQARQNRYRASVAQSGLGEKKKNQKKDEKDKKRDGSAGRLGNGRGKKKELVHGATLHYTRLGSEAQSSRCSTAASGATGHSDWATATATARTGKAR